VESDLQAVRVAADVRGSAMTDAELASLLAEITREGRRVLRMRQD